MASDIVNKRQIKGLTFVTTRWLWLSCAPVVTGFVCSLVVLWKIAIAVSLFCHYQANTQLLRFMGTMRDKAVMLNLYGMRLPQQNQPGVPDVLRDLHGDVPYKHRAGTA